MSSLLVHTAASRAVFVFHLSCSLAPAQGIAPLRSRSCVVFGEVTHLTLLLNTEGKMEMPRPKHDGALQLHGRRGPDPGGRENSSQLCLADALASCELVASCVLSCPLKEL